MSEIRKAQESAKSAGQWEPERKKVWFYETLKQQLESEQKGDWWWIPRFTKAGWRPLGESGEAELARRTGQNPSAPTAVRSDIWEGFGQALATAFPGELRGPTGQAAGAASSHSQIAHYGGKTVIFTKSDGPQKKMSMVSVEDPNSTLKSVVDRAPNSSTFFEGIETLSIQMVDGGGNYDICRADWEQHKMGVFLDASVFSALQFQCRSD